jgi:general secretion pathway protein D
MLAQVAKGWELPVKKFADGPSLIVEQPEIPAGGSADINSKLDSIIIPKLDFTDASIREAIDLLRLRAADLDTDSDPQTRGVNIVLKLPQGAPEESNYITLSLSQIPLRAALEYVSRAANLKIKIDPYAVVVVPASENTEVLITKQYRVPPNFIQSAPTGASRGGAGVTGRSTVREFLEDQGVAFPKDASASYNPSTSRLTIKNTQANLDIVDTLVETALSTPPVQIEIEAKFLEVNQNNLNELGFDWLIGQFALSGGSGIYGSGGTEGFGRQINSQIDQNGTFNPTVNTGFPINNTQTGLPLGANSATSGAVTAGNRGGAGGTYETAITLNAVDALLLN